MGLLKKARPGQLPKQPQYEFAMEDGPVHAAEQKLAELRDAQETVNAEIAALEHQRAKIADDAVRRLTAGVTATAEVDVTALLGEGADENALGADLQRRDAEIQGRIIVLKAKQSILRQAVTTQEGVCFRVKSEAKARVFEEAKAEHRKIVREIVRAIFAMDRANKHETALRDALARPQQSCGTLPFMTFSRAGNADDRNGSPAYYFVKEAAEAGYITSQERDYLELDD